MFSGDAEREAHPARHGRRREVKGRAPGGVEREGLPPDGGISVRESVCHGLFQRLCLAGHAGVVGVDEGHGPGRIPQRFQERPFFVRDPVDGAEELQVFAADVGQERVRRREDLAKAGEFARVIRPRFDHCAFIFRRQAEDGLRHADVVVEIRLRAQYAVLRSQDAGDHVFRRCLSVAPPDRQDGDGEPVPVDAGQPAERRRAIVHDDKRESFPRIGGERRVDDGRDGPAGRGGGNVPVAVEAVAAERDKELAGAERPRVRGDSREVPGRNCSPVPDLAMGNLQHIASGKFHPFSRRKVSTSSLSSK